MEEFFAFDIRSLKNNTKPLDVIGNTSASIFATASKLHSYLRMLDTGQSPFRSAARIRSPGGRLQFSEFSRKSQGTSLLC